MTYTQDYVARLESQIRWLINELVEKQRYLDTANRERGMLKMEINRLKSQHASNLSRAKRDRKEREET